MDFNFKARRKPPAVPPIIFIVPEPAPGDDRPRNAFGMLKGFGEAYAAYYRAKDAEVRGGQGQATAG